MNHSPRRRLLQLTACLASGGVLLSVPALAEQIPIDANRFEVVKRESGPVNYYAVEQEGGMSFIRGTYRPPWKTTVLGVQLPDDMQHGLKKLSWRWRARTLPLGGNECADGKEDNAATVYVIWKSGLRWYTLRYLWSATAPKGAICGSKRKFFVNQDSMIMQSGAPLGQWMTQEIDLTSEFTKHFRGGDPNGDVPSLVGIGILTDGDQTSSEAAADYADFTFTR